MAFISNGTTMLDAGSFNVSLGSKVLIKTLDASNDANVDFEHGSAGVVIDSTYPIYIFDFLNIHPANDDVNLMFQANGAGETGFNETITSAHFRATTGEDGSSSAVAYISGGHLAQETSYQLIAGSIGNDNDQGVSGELVIYNPSSTTFVKHFTGNFQSIAHSNRTNNQYPTGYFNTTTALDQFIFKFSSGNISTGTFKLYGIKDS